MLCKLYLFPYLLKQAYLWINKCEMRCHGVGARSVSVINHFGIGYQQGVWIKGVIGELIARILKISRRLNLYSR